MTNFAGMRGTGSFATDERPKNFREFILWRDPNGRAPLTALLSKVKKEKTDDPEFSWWEEQQDIVRLQLNDGDDMVAGDTTVVVDSGALQLLPGDLLQVEPTTEVADYTGTEIIQVVSVTNDTTFVVLRGRAGTTAGGITDDDFFTRIGSVHEEGSGSPNVASKNPTKLRNYTQIFKTAFEVTGTAAETNTRTGDPIQNERRRKTFDHAEKMEQAFFWGKSHEMADGGNGQPMRFTGGIREFLTTHRKVYTTAVTEDTLLDDLAPLFDYQAEGAGNSRLAFVGNSGLNEINKIVKNSSSTRINYEGKIKFFGMELHEYTIPQGTIMFRTHPLFNVHPVYKKSMFVLNMSGIIYRPMQNRDTRVKENVQANDADTRKDMWITECGLELRHEVTMGYFGNISAT